MVWAILAGAIIGAFVAFKNGGTRLDQAQYAAVFALIGAVLTMFLAILLTRLV